MSAIAGLVKRDALVIVRDGMLLPMILYVPVVAFALGRLVHLVPIAGFDLYIAPFLVGLGGSLIGFVFGFGMIEEHEQQTDCLLRVVPLSPLRYVSYQLLSTGGLGFALGLVTALLYGRAVDDPIALLGMTAVAGLQAPLFMLFLGVVSRNKIEGMAMGKLGNAIAFVPALLFVVPTGWQWTLWWCPHYWVYVGLLRAYAGDGLLETLPIHWPAPAAWVPPVAALVLLALAIALLARVERRRIG